MALLLTIALPPRLASLASLLLIAVLLLLFSLIRILSLRFLLPRLLFSLHLRENFGLAIFTKLICQNKRARR